MATLRTLGAGPSGDGRTGAVHNWVWHLSELGQAPLAWAPPDGYPDTAAVGFLGGTGRVAKGDTEWQLPVLVAMTLDAPQWSTR